MTNTFEILYESLVGEPRPWLWPDYLREHAMKGHGLYSFYRGLCLGLQLGAAAFRGENEL